MEFAGHEAIPRESYDSHWVPNIDLTLHKITAKRLIDRANEKKAFYRGRPILSINMHDH